MNWLLRTVCRLILMEVASMLVSTRWLEYLTQLDPDETSKRDQPLVRLLSPIPGTQIAESDAKWRAEEKTAEKRARSEKETFSTLTCTGK